MGYCNRPIEGTNPVLLLDNYLYRFGSKHQIEHRKIMVKIHQGFNGKDAQFSNGNHIQETTTGYICRHPHSACHGTMTLLKKQVTNQTQINRESSYLYLRSCNYHQQNFRINILPTIMGQFQSANGNHQNMLLQLAVPSKLRVPFQIFQLQLLRAKNFTGPRGRDFQGGFFTMNHTESEHKPI